MQVEWNVRGDKEVHGENGCGKMLAEVLRGVKRPSG